MVTAQRAPEKFGAVEVVDREHGAALVLVSDECEALGLPRLLVARDVDVNDLAKLREDDDNVAFAQVVWQPADVHVRRVLILRMPRLVDIPLARVAHGV